MPIYGQHSSPLFIKCDSEIGKGTATSEIYNHTTAVRNQHAPTGGLLGVLIITAINSAREDPETDQYRYLNAYISLEKSSEDEEAEDEAEEELKTEITE